MIKEDKSAAFAFYHAQRSFLGIGRDVRVYIFKTNKFTTAKHSWLDGRVTGHVVGWTEEEFAYVLQVQKQEPVPLVRWNIRQYWMFLDSFWWEDNNLDKAEVSALVLHRIRKKRTQIERAFADLHCESQGTQRTAIPDKVKNGVWQRDGGKCQKCGGRENLEFDHIIPVSKGGSSTERNVQLLCEHCNRSKGRHLA
jgi:5-methylcytosine-specific restriction endonuclease McrA